MAAAGSAPGPLAWASRALPPMATMLAKPAWDVARPTTPPSCMLIVAPALRTEGAVGGVAGIDARIPKAGACDLDREELPSASKTSQFGGSSLRVKVSRVGTNIDRQAGSRASDGSLAASAEPPVSPRSIGGMPSSPTPKMAAGGSEFSAGRSGARPDRSLSSAGSSAPMPIGPPPRRRRSHRPGWPCRSDHAGSSRGHVLADGDVARAGERTAAQPCRRHRGSGQDGLARPRHLRSPLWIENAERSFRRPWPEPPRPFVARATDRSEARKEERRAMTIPPHQHVDVGQKKRPREAGVEVLRQVSYRQETYRAVPWL